MVAPVLGETNLFIQSCCMIKPATLIPIPVHKMARSLGILDSRNIFSSIPSPLENNVFQSISMTPANSDSMEIMRSIVPRNMVDKYFWIKMMYTPFFFI